MTTSAKMYGLPPEPKLGCARWVKRFAFMRTPVQAGLQPVEGWVWLEHYWRQQVQWTDGSWRDSYSTAFLESEQVAFDRRTAPDGVRLRRPRARGLDRTAPAPPRSSVS